jgi:hypothetical protein
LDAIDCKQISLNLIDYALEVVGSQVNRNLVVKEQAKKVKSRALKFT